MIKLTIIPLYYIKIEFKDIVKHFVLQVFVRFLIILLKYL